MMRSFIVRRLRRFSGSRAVGALAESGLSDSSDTLVLPGLGAARRGFEDFSTIFVSAIGLAPNLQILDQNTDCEDE